MKKSYKNLSSNDIQICEIDFEMKSLKIVMLDLLILINDCIKYNIDYEVFKCSYLKYQNIFNDYEKMKKGLESDK